MRLFRASALLAIGLLVQVWVDRPVAPREQGNDQLLAARPEEAPNALVPVTLRQAAPDIESTAGRPTSPDASSETSPARPSRDQKGQYAVGIAGVTVGRPAAAPPNGHGVTSRTRSAARASDPAPLARVATAPDSGALERSFGAPTLTLMDALPSPMRQLPIGYRREPATLGAEFLPVPAAAAPTGRPQHHDMITIRRVIQEYATAFGRLDPGAAKRVWPTLDEQALARAFNGLQSQSLTLDDCGVTITGAVAAQASCHGRATYLPKIGRQRPFSTTGEWTFSLARAGSAWVIQSAAVQ